MNILLNNYCNLNCEYCFANKVRAEHAENMKLEDFKWILQFLKASNNLDVRLLGGEPTLHPHFMDFVLEAAVTGFKHIHVFSNGTFTPKIGYFLTCLAEKMSTSLLLNYNAPEIIGDATNELIHAHLQEFQHSRVKVSLGINFYSTAQDYSYVIDAASRYGIESIRWSLVVPNSEEKAAHPREYFKQFTPLIMQFIRDATLQGLKPCVDCNNIPLCLIDDETLRWLSLVAASNTRVSVCSPVIDVLPTLEAIRCFAFNDYKVNIKEFANIQDLHKHFENQIDAKLMGSPLFTECLDCASYQLRNKSCACLAYSRRDAV